jgi:hypothetical protein
MARVTADPARYRYVFFAAPGYAAGRQKDLETVSGIEVDGTNIRIAWAVQTARQVLEKYQLHGARISASRHHLAHVEKAMQSRMISADRL